MALGKISSLVISEAMGPGASFAVSWGAQTCIGTLPIVYFGSQAQKEKYLPDLASGKKFGAYCLTEPARARTPSAAAAPRPCSMMTDRTTF